MSLKNGVCVLCLLRVSVFSSFLVSSLFLCVLCNSPLCNLFFLLCLFYVRCFLAQGAEDLWLLHRSPGASSRSWFIRSVGRLILSFFFFKKQIHMCSIGRLCVLLFLHFVMCYFASHLHSWTAEKQIHMCSIDRLCVLLFLHFVMCYCDQEQLNLPCGRWPTKTCSKHATWWAKRTAFEESETLAVLECRFASFYTFLLSSFGFALPCTKFQTLAN